MDEYSLSQQLNTWDNIKSEQDFESVYLLCLQICLTVELDIDVGWPVGKSWDFGLGWIWGQT